MRPDRAVAAIAVAGLVLVSCASTPAATPTTAASTVASVADPPATTTAVSASGPRSAGSVAPGTAGRSDPAALAFDGVGIEIPVSGGPLPVEVAAGVTRAGGELADPTGWYARYGTWSMPHIVGAQVTLAEATIRTAVSAAGWSRTDELQWLFTDTDHDGINPLLDLIATSTGFADWPSTTSKQTVEGADCMQRSYHAPGEVTVWRLQGCAYPHYPGMYAIGVGRDTTTNPATSDGAGGSGVEPTAAPVAAAVAGRVTGWSVVFGHPATVGSTSTLDIHVDVVFTGDAESATQRLATGPLSGWRRFGGDASVMFTGVPGASWVIGAGTATFTGHGRLVP